MKLIYEHGEISGPDWVTTFFPFEYESKDKFVFDLLEATKDWNPDGYETFKVFKFIGEYAFPYIELRKEEIEEIEKNIYTLEEWFENEKINPVL